MSSRRDDVLAPLWYGEAHGLAAAIAGEERGPGEGSVREYKIRIDDIYVPVKRRKTFDPERAEALAADILEHGQISAILVRKDDERYVLVEGLHRLEACKALGEQTILASLVQARRP